MYIRNRETALGSTKSLQVSWLVRLWREGLQSFAARTILASVRTEMCSQCSKISLLEGFKCIGVIQRSVLHFLLVVTLDVMTGGLHHQLTGNSGSD
jgi:hypothetical protein